MNYTVMVEAYVEALNEKTVLQLKELLNSISNGTMNCCADESLLKEDEEIIIYMMLGYPINLSWCRIGDFRNLYLDSKTPVKLEMEEGHFQTVYKCMPLIHTTKKALDEKSNKSSSSCDGQNVDTLIHFASVGISSLIYLYLDYLVYEFECAYYNEVEPSLDYDDITDSNDELEELEKTFRHKSDHSEVYIKCAYSKKSFFLKNRSSSILYYITRMLSNGELSDEQMYFEDFVDEAKKIKSIIEESPLGEQILLQYPELSKMLDIDELRIYHLWRTFHSWFLDLNFLKKDWYDDQVYSDKFCEYYEKDNNKNLNTLKKYTPVFNLPQEYIDKASKTTWGYKKEPNRILETIGTKYQIIS